MSEFGVEIWKSEDYITEQRQHYQDGIGVRQWCRKKFEKNKEGQGNEGTFNDSFNKLSFFEDEFADEFY